jgi:hypothetical protein
MRSRRRAGIGRPTPGRAGGTTRPRSTSRSGCCSTLMSSMLHPPGADPRSARRAVHSTSPRLQGAFIAYLERKAGICRPKTVGGTSPPEPTPAGRSSPWINYYNQENRLHSSCDYQSPVDYEQSLTVSQRPEVAVVPRLSWLIQHAHWPLEDRRTQLVQDGRCGALVERESQDFLQP